MASIEIETTDTTTRSTLGLVSVGYYSCFQETGYALVDLSAKQLLTIVAKHQLQFLSDMDLFDIGEGIILRLVYCKNNNNNNSHEMVTKKVYCFEQLIDTLTDWLDYLSIDDK